jgi:NADH:ubiquinone oxidoreductase subunit B-like Fe-S oxidoreductase
MFVGCPPTKDDLVVADLQRKIAELENKLTKARRENSAFYESDDKSSPLSVAMASSLLQKITVSSKHVTGRHAVKTYKSFIENFVTFAAYVTAYHRHPV